MAFTALSYGRPFCFLTVTLSGLFWTLCAITVDTAYYSGPMATGSFGALYQHVRHNPVITPLNNLLYNTQTSNLAEHGLHPHYQHIIASLPQLLGPALVLLIASAYPFNLRTLQATFNNNRLASATTGTLFLSLFPHQEPRFLLPTVPLILTSIRIPISQIRSRIFWTTWFVFNIALAILMGIYHQGGIIPVQLAMPLLITQSINTTHSEAHNVEVFWWKTYPPPNFLLGGESLHPATKRSLNISTVPLMGYPQKELVFMLMQHMPTCDPTWLERFILHKEKTDIFVVAPLSAWRLDPSAGQQAYQYPPVSNFSFAIEMTQPPTQLQMTNLAVHRRHFNLDDMDFGDDGVWPTLERVVGRRGLGVWKVDRICGPIQYVDAHTGEKLESEDVKQETSATSTEADATLPSIEEELTEKLEASLTSSATSVSSATKEVISNFTATPGEVLTSELKEDAERRFRISTTTVPTNFSAQGTDVVV